MPPEGEIVGYMDAETGQMLPSGSSAPSSPSYPPVANANQQKADLLDKIRPSDVVDEMRLSLMGQEMVNGNVINIPELKDLALTKLGAWQICNLLKAPSNKNTSISKLNDNEIRQRILSISRTAQKLMVDHWKEFGIKNTSQLWYVHEILFTVGFIVMKQCEGAGVRKMIIGTTTETRQINSQEKPKRSWGLFRH